MASVGEKLYDAAGDGDHKLVDKLIKEDGTAVNWKRDNGETPLHAAAIANHEKVVDSLLKANADPNAKNDDGESPLHYAAMNDSGDAGCAKKLIAAGAKRFENIIMTFIILNIAAMGSRVRPAPLEEGSWEKQQQDSIFYINILCNFVFNVEL